MGDRRARGLRTRSGKLWFLFVGTLWTTALVNEICHVIMNSNARIDYDMSQHSSFDYFASHQTSTVHTVSIVSQIFGLVLTDILLVRHIVFTIPWRPYSYGCSSYDVIASGEVYGRPHLWVCSPS